MSDDNFNPRFRLAGWCVCASAVVGAFGVVFLVLFFVGFLSDSTGLWGFGTLNDICIIIQYLLMLPVVLAFHRIIRVRRPGLSTAAMLIGIVGIGVVVFFQALLVAGVMSFDDQVAYATAGLLIIGVWLLVTSRQLHSAENSRVSLLVEILGLLYLGYPIWAFVVGRWLLSGKWTTVEPNLSLGGDTA